MQPMSSTDPAHPPRKRNFRNLQLSLATFTETDPLPLDDKLTALVQSGLNEPLNKDDLEQVAALGQGNGGTVYKVRHVPSQLLMARKVIYLETNPEIRKSISQELETLKICKSEYIVKYYGQFVDTKSVTICMEYMDRGSLDKIYKHTGPLPESIIACINASVVDGLNYLKDLNITHRDLKPSNILVNGRGEVKLCDFGVSGVLINSIAETFVGTSTYMSPERISGETYSATGDVWSLGLTLMELAKGKFPFLMSGTNTSFSIFDLLQRIVNEPPPRLDESFSLPFQQYVESCLQREPANRLTPRQLLQTQFYISGKQSYFELVKWASALPIV